MGRAPEAKAELAQRPRLGSTLGALEEQWRRKAPLSGLGDGVREVREGANYGGMQWGATEEF